MSLSALVGGADCGPANPLQSLMKLQQDRGQFGQQDRFVPSAGPSNQPQIHVDQARAAREAEAFYHAAAQSERQRPRNAFDMKPLDRALTPQQGSTALQSQPGWVNDFLRHQQQQRTPSPAMTSRSPMTASHTGTVLRPLPQRSGFLGYQGSQTQGRSFQQDEEALLADHFEYAHTESKWDAAFQQNIDQALRNQRSASPPLEQNQRTAENDAALAKTAAELLKSIESDEGMNQKLAQSDFLKLMRQIRDEEIVVDGDQLVQNNEHSSSKGKQKATDQVAAERERSVGTSIARPEQYATESDAIIDGYEDVQDIWEAEDRARMEEQEELMREGTTPLRRQFQGDGGLVPEDLEEAGQLDEGIDERFSVENIIGGAHEAPASHFRVQSRVDEGWGFLQDQWDAWEAHSTGMRPAGTSQKTQPPQSAQEWMDAATILQEQEQEPRAIEALRKALEIDPDFAAAWLSLAASLSNENQRNESLDAVSSWVRSLPKYQGFVGQFEQLQGAYNQQGSTLEKHAHLTSLLVFLAQVTSDEAVIDADLQVALGVLFNSSDEPPKAADCFMAALSIRPNDHQLYNRIGAALANSGRPEDALRAYEEALRLRPEYARARYNMAVSLVHLQRYREAAQQLVEALQRQQEQSSDADLGRYLDTTTESMSEVLWETLQTCCNLLDRVDLVMACKAKDLTSIQRIGL